MIGFDAGGPGGGGWRPQPAADRVREMWDERDAWVRRVARPLEPIWNLVENVGRRTISVLETVEILTPIHYERWVTAGDERTCPECAPLHGMTWREASGPSPPLHVNCRCRRVFAFTEWQRREVQEWRQRSIPTVRRVWRITGWR
ncbi:MAG: phage minor head protein [Thermomicrobiales bacterium]|jgi:hypothetical protein